MSQAPLEQAEPPLVLAIDAGISSVRVGLFDCQARAVAGLHARDDHPLHTSGEGAAIEEPAHLVQRIEGLLDDVLARAGRFAGNIGTVRMDTFAGNYLGLDAHNNPVTPIYTYADTRPAREVEELRLELDVADVHQRTGCPLHTSYLPPRIRWLQRSAPSLAARVHQWVDAGTYLYRRWTGVADVPMSYSMASWSGMLEMRSLTWDEGLVRHLGLPADALPDLDYAADVRGLAPAFASRWPALADVPFFLAVGDGAAANVGSGCVDASRVALTVGTTGAMRVLLAGVPRSVPQGLWAYRLDAR
ncbi:MAG: FGGY family carbohydrate kinase, partial [Chloroflexota bacterium]|nr:FGGY family carbohydrate kinase [Chloroflexota bacterium]